MDTVARAIPDMGDGVCTMLRAHRMGASAMSLKVEFDLPEGKELKDVLDYSSGALGILHLRVVGDFTVKGADGWVLITELVKQEWRAPL